MLGALAATQLQFVRIAGVSSRHAREGMSGLPINLVKPLNQPKLTQNIHSNRNKKSQKLA